MDWPYSQLSDHFFKATKFPVILWYTETLLVAFAKFGPEFITDLSDAEKESLKRLSEVTFVPPTIVDIPLTY